MVVVVVMAGSVVVLVAEALNGLVSDGGGVCVARSHLRKVCANTSLL